MVRSNPRSEDENATYTSGVHRISIHRSFSLSLVDMHQNSPMVNQSSSPKLEYSGNVGGETTTENTEALE